MHWFSIIPSFTTFINFSFISINLWNVSTYNSTFHSVMDDHYHPSSPNLSQTRLKHDQRNITPIRISFGTKLWRQTFAATFELCYLRAVLVNAFNRVRNVSSLTSDLNATQKRFYLSSFWNVCNPSPALGAILPLPSVKTQQSRNNSLDRVK